MRRLTVVNRRSAAFRKRQVYGDWWKMAVWVTGSADFLVFTVVYGRIH